MTVQEASNIVHMIHTAYSYDNKVTTEELADRIDLFAVFFSDYPYETVRTAVKGWIQYNKFMPTLSDLKEACDMLIRLGKNLANANVIGEGETDPETESKLEALCKSVGFGYPNDFE